MTLDFHSHYYPPEYLDAIKKGPSRVRIDYDQDQNPRLHYPGDYNVLVPGHRDLDTARASCASTASTSSC
jgi:aminocarboxymuconate-semialdehyde decarboxylase